jgi:hypothetical protein
MIGSEALPHVHADVADAPISAASPAPARPRGSSPTPPPQGRRHRRRGPIHPPAGRPARSAATARSCASPSPPSSRSASYHVYLDAATGEPVAREQTLRFASGTVAFNVPSAARRAPARTSSRRRLGSPSRRHGAVRPTRRRARLPRRHRRPPSPATGDLRRTSTTAGADPRARTCPQARRQSPCGTTPTTSASTPSWRLHPRQPGQGARPRRSPPTSPTSTSS